MAAKNDNPIVAPVAKNSTKKKPRTVIVEPIAGLFFMMYIGLQPIHSQYIFARLAKQQGFQANVSSNDTSFHCGPEGGNQTSPSMLEDFTRKEIQAQASVWLICLNTAATVPGFFTSIILGSYSDRAGRKVSMLLPLIGSTLFAVTYVLTVYLELPLPCLFIGNILFGLSGTSGALMVSALAYIFDTTNTKWRTFRIVVLDMTIALCIGIGMMIFGIVTTKVGFALSYVISVAVYACLTLGVLLLVPETIVKAETSQAPKLLSRQGFQRAWKLYYRTDDKMKGAKLAVALLSFFLVAMTVIAKGEVLTLFMIGSPLCWNSQFIGYFSAASTIIYAFSALILNRPLNKVMSEAWVVALGALSGMASLILLSFVMNAMMMWIVPCVGFLSLICLPVLRGMMSRLADADEQGILFATIACTETLCNLIGSIIFNSIYSSTLNVWQGMVFFVMSTLFLMAALLMMLFRYGIRTMDDIKKETKGKGYNEFTDSINIE